MQISTTGIVIYSANFGESSLFVKCLTPDFGVVKGIVKTIKRKGKINAFVLGNLLKINHFSRNESLGVISGELLKGYGFKAISNARNLMSLRHICATYDIFLGQDHCEHLGCFDLLLAFLSSKFQIDDNLLFAANYINLMKDFMAKMGYGFDLEKCVLTGSKENLRYISPKSGCAVSKDAAVPYVHLLMPLPDFFTTSNCEQITDPTDIKAGAKIITHFLHKINLNLQIRQMNDICTQMLRIIEYC